MPFYNYTCPKKCKISKLTKYQKQKLAIERNTKNILIWTEQHGMNSRPYIKCPVCGSSAERTWYGTKQFGYIRGNCYLNKADCKRQMDLNLLETGNDPYGYMRQSGEVDDLKQRLKKKKIPRV
jgi:hypothetical protein